LMNVAVQGCYRSETLEKAQRLGSIFCTPAPNAGTRSKAEYV
jgi:hypothetical protein